MARDENLVFSSGYNEPTLFWNLQKEVFSMQVAFHSPNGHGQAFHIITPQPHPLSTTQGFAEDLHQ
jgi:hypothetical protein